MDKLIKRKRGLELVTSLSSGHKESSEKFRYPFYIIWPSLIMHCKAVFELFKKLHLQIYASQFMTSWIIPVLFVLLSLEIVERKGKIQKCEYLEKEKSFLDEIKILFHSFRRAIIWWKNKNLIKISGHKL